MFFTVSNDDGYQAEGFRCLVEAILRRGHDVLAVAPHTQCSAKSQSLTLDRPIMLHEIEIREHLRLYSVEGTPADASRIALVLAERKADFCMAGVNRGENVSAGVLYSGTVAAAREGAMAGLLSIAVSLAAGGTHEGLLRVADFAVRLAEINRAANYPRFGVLNVNAPALPPERWKEPVFAPVSASYFRDRYTERESPFGQRYFWLGTAQGTKDELHMDPHAPGTDAALLSEGHVTLTMLGGVECAAPDGIRSPGGAV